MAYETLQGLFTGICDAIRAKESSTSLINHQDIPNRITALTGDGGNANFSYGVIVPKENIKFTWNQYTSNYYSFPHGLSVVPNFIIVYIDESMTPTWTGADFYFAMRMPWRKNIYLQRVYNTSGAQTTDSAATDVTPYLVQADAVNVKIGSSSGINLLAGIKYYWVAGYVPLV